MRKLCEGAFLLIMSILSLAACQEYKIDSQQWNGTIETDAKEAYTVLGRNPSDIVFNISSSVPWRIKSNVQWCTATPAMSATGGLTAVVTVKMETNPTKKPRIAQLTLEVDGEEENKVITITQEEPSVLEIVKPEEMLPVDGGTVRFGVCSNKPWTATTTSQFLADMDKNSGEGNETSEVEYVTITVPHNDGARKAGTITVKTELDEVTFSITQDGAYMEVSENSLVFSETGEAKTIVVNANVTWEPKVPEEYKDFLTAEKMSDTELKIIIKNNIRFTKREGEIEINESNNHSSTLSVPIKFSQDIRFKLEGMFTVDEDGCAKLQSGGKIIAKYLIKTGTLIFKLKNINLTGNSSISFEGRDNKYNAQDSNYNGSYRCLLNPSGKTSQGLWCGGSIEYWGYTYANANNNWNYEFVNSITEVRMELAKKSDSSKMDIRLYLNGELKNTATDRSNLWDDGQKEGYELTVNTSNFANNTDSYVAVESIEYIPGE